MALRNPEDENEDPRQYIEALGAGPENVGDSSTGEGSPTGASGPTQDQGSGIDRFVSFDRYYNANAGNAKNAANKIASDISGQANAATLSLSNDQNAFGDAVNAGSTGQATVRQNPTAGGYDVEETYYSGPNGFSPSQGTFEQMARVQDSFGALENRKNGGINALMGQSGGTGNSRLNSALVNKAGGERFDELFKQYDYLGNAVGNATERGAGMVSDAKERVNATNSAARDTERIQEESEKKANDEQAAQNVGQSQEYIQWLNDFASGRMAGPGERKKRQPWDYL
jgi:hypothetical protein